MYRINLHRELAEKRLYLRRRALRTAGFVVILGIQVLMVGGLAISAILLGEQAKNLKAQVRQLSPTAGTQVGPELQVARDLVNIRRGRIDWSPKLAAISEQMERSLILFELGGQTAGRGQTTRLTLTGSARGGGMEPVTRFLENLRGDRRLSRDFSDIHVGTIEGSGSRFQILCEAPR